MAATPRPQAPVRRRARDRAENLPDPRPLTEYTVEVSEDTGNTRVIVRLDQPCVIRTPEWAFIDSVDGSRSYAPTLKVVDNQTFEFEFAGLLAASVGTIEAPYQDMQVQNFQGGFVRPGGQWFRPPGPPGVV